MIEQKTIKVNKVSMNKDNPRVFTKANIADTVRSILTFPEMLYGIRSIAIKDNIVLGGNLRLKSLKTILDTPIDEIAKIIADNTKDKSESRITFLIDYWTEFKETKEFNFIIADNLTDQQAKEFLIRDNVSTGSWDMDMLANNWDSEELNDWGVSVWNGGDSENVDIEEEKDAKYTKNIKAPIYEPKNDKPEISKLFDNNRTNELIKEISTSDIPNEDKQLLIAAAHRHTVFNYEKIADYYANSSKEVQSLMENSALVIIDANKALELGFLKLSESIKEQYLSDYENE